MTNHVVLIVEDDAEHLKVVERICAGLGLATVAFGTASAALACLAEERRCCLVLLDLSLPFEENDLPRPQTGLNALELLRARFSREILPVIVMTAQDDEYRYSVRAMQAGANDFAKKPFDEDFEAVDDKIKRALKLSCETQSPSGCPNVARAALGSGGSKRRRRTDDEPTTGDDMVRIVLDGTLEDGLIRIEVNGQTCLFREVPFRALCQLTVAAQKGNGVDLTRLGNASGSYNVIARLRDELSKKGGLPRELTKQILRSDKHGVYRIDLSRVSITVRAETMKHRFGNYLAEAR